MRIIKLDEKKIMINIKGLFNEYAPVNRSMPKSVKKPANIIIRIWKNHHEYFI